MSQTTYPIGLSGSIYPPTIAGVTDLGSYFSFRHRNNLYG